jgi:dodecin
MRAFPRHGRTLFRLAGVRRERSVGCLEITAQSSEGFEDAIRQGIDKATETVRNISGAWVKEQSVAVNNGEIIGYRVDLKVTFLLD